MSLSYGFVVGAPGLRVFWAVYGVLTTYTMVQINQAAVMWFIPFMVLTASLYTSLSHTKKSDPIDCTTPCMVLFIAGLCTSAFAVLYFILRFTDLATALPPALLSVVNYGIPPSIQEHQAAVFASRDNGLFSAVGFVLSWSVALLLGPVLLCRYLASEMKDFGTEQGPGREGPGAWMGYLFFAASMCAAMFSTSFVPFSFAYFLGRPAPDELTFYKALPFTVWETKAFCLMLKACLFMVYRRDKHRACEWLLHTYGDIAFLLLLFPLFITLHTIMPTFQDAMAHAYVLAQLLGEVGAYICAIYMFNPEFHQVSAHLNGLFNLGAKKKQN